MKAVLHFPVTLFFLFVSYFLPAQSYIATPKSQRISDKCGGYYEFLPGSYNQPGNEAVQYPLIIDITGSGGEGDGSTQSLSKLLNFDVPYFINSQVFPDTFYSNNIPYSFIVIAPQFSSRGTGTDVQDVIDFVSVRYRIDVSRIYLIGFSNGGEPAWSYPAMGKESAEKIAAVVPIAAVNTNTDHTGANFFVEAKLPVWALHSTEDQGDETGVENSINFVNAINNLNPVVPAELTLLTGTHRETWANVFDPAKRYPVGNKNLSIYEWMLQYERVSSTLPVSLLSFDASLLNDNRVQLIWKTSREYNNQFFTIEKSKDGSRFTESAIISSKGNGVTDQSYLWEDINPFEGVNYYRLSQTDTDGKKTFFDIIKVNISNKIASIRAFPTFINNEPLKILVNNVITGKVEIRVIGLNGRLIYKNSMAAQAEFFIPSASLSSGLNVVEIKTDNLTRKIKVLKNH